MAMQPPPRLFVPDVEPLAAANRRAEPAALGLMGAAPAAAAAAGGPRQELWEALTEEERGRRDRLRMLRHKYGLLTSGDTPPAPRKQHWLTPRHFRRSGFDKMNVGRARDIMQVMTARQLQRLRETYS